MTPVFACSPVRRLAAALALACLGLLLAAAAAPAKKVFDLPAEAATEALRKFSAQSGAEVVFAADAPAGIRTNAVRGEFSPAEAIDRLLAGTGLKATRDEASGAFMVNRAADPNAPRAAAPAVRPARDDNGDEQVVQLDAFTVSTARDRGYRATNSVSGSRVATPVRDLPSSVQVVTPEFLRDQNAVKFEDFAPYLGLTAQSTIEGRYSIRGFSTIASKRDGFNVSDNAIHDTFWMERLEVVKGPSSLLYGITPPGGLINAISKRPQARQSTTVRATIGSFDTYRGDLDTTGTLATTSRGRLLYRVSAFASEGDTHRDNETISRQGLAPSLTWEITPATTLWLNARYFHDDSLEGGQNWPINFDQTAILPGVDRGFSQNGPGAFREMWDYNFTAELTHRFSANWSARLAANYLQVDQRFIRRNTNRETARGSGAISVFAIYRDFSNQATSTILDIVGKQDFGPVKNQVLAGAFFQHDHNPELRFQNNNLPAFPVFSTAGRSFTVGSFPADYALQENALSRRNSRAVYLIDTLTFWDDRVNVMGGLRREFLTGDMRNNVTGALTPIPRVLATVPQYGASVRLADPLTVYVNYSESINRNPAPTVEPQTGEGLEFGAKFEALDGRISGALAFFDVDLANIARTDFTLPTRPVTLSGRERVKGYDLELFLFPTDAWQIFLTYQNLDAKVVQNQQTPVLNGTALPSQAEHNFNVWSKYSFRSGALRGFSAGLGAIYRSEIQWFGSPANYQVRAPAYTRYDASLSYETKLGGRPVTFQLNLRNLADKFYYERTFAAAGRHFIASAEYRF